MLVNMMHKMRALCVAVFAMTHGDCFVMQEQSGRPRPHAIAVTFPSARPPRARAVNGGGEAAASAVGKASGADPSARSSLLVWERLLDYFQGDFDNYRQVVQDRARDLLPREGGGHENFHCVLMPVSDTGRLAAFYFDGNPQRIFRFRYYELRRPPPSSADDGAGAVEMRLYTLRPELEARLRARSEVPSSWPAIFAEFEGSARDKIVSLPNCEIVWSLEADPVQHAYTRTIDGDGDDGIHAVMVHGEAVVESTILPGTKIRVIDQLSLYENTFYIDDRGLDPVTGAFIYGNQRGVPYRMERVASLDARRERVVVDEELRWTMGKEWRSEAEYEEKLRAAGGPSVGMKRPSPSSS